MENRLCLKSKQREDRTDQEETTDASSHIRHSVAIPYPVPQKNLTVQVNKLSIIVKQCFAAVRFILQWNRLFVARHFTILSRNVGILIGSLLRAAIQISICCLSKLLFPSLEQR